MAFKTRGRHATRTPVVGVVGSRDPGYGPLSLSKRLGDAGSRICSHYTSHGPARGNRYHSLELQTGGAQTHQLAVLAEDEGTLT